jgi:histidinol-phosphate phosphatase family protein
MNDTGYPDDPDRVELVPGAVEAVRELTAGGLVPAVVSNQSGVGRGLITRERAAAVHARFVELFAVRSGVRLPCFYCPHTPGEGCGCRKPKPGLLVEAAGALGLGGARSVIVGDRWTDVAAGRAFGAATVLLGGGGAGRPRPETPAADHVAADWADACRWVLSWARHGGGGHGTH